MADKIIEFKNVSFTYRDSKVPAVKNMSFAVERGSWLAIIGRNGSGKSTISRLINGLLVPDPEPDSAIYIDGEKLTEDNVWQVRDQVGIVFQNPDNQFVGATVADDVAFGLENRGMPRPQMLKRVKAAIKAVDMLDYANTEPSNLSGGQKQRVAVAGILAVEPKIIIFDEATSMLDPEGKRKILSIARRLQQERHLTVISITHDVEEAALSDQVLVVNQGNFVAQGKPQEIFSQEQLVQNIGDDLPFVYCLQKDLATHGIDLKLNAINEDEMIKALCQLNSKM